MDIKRITLWGDSVMRGVIYDEQRGRYRLLAENSASQAAHTLGLELSNRSRMGCTVTKGLQLMKRELTDQQQEQAAFIEFGGNDSDYDWKAIAADPYAEHQPHTPLTRFKEQLQNMVTLAVKHGMTVVLSTLPPIHAERYFDFFVRRDGLDSSRVLCWLGDIQHIYRWHERYNNAVVQVALDCGCPLMDLRDAFLNVTRYEDLLCADGIHPNEQGHALMNSVMQQFVTAHA